MHWAITLLELNRDIRVRTKTESFQELSRVGEAVVGDEGREDDTEERKGGDDNEDETALLGGTALGLLKEPAKSRWAEFLA